MVTPPGMVPSTGITGELHESACQAGALDYRVDDGQLLPRGGVEETSVNPRIVNLRIANPGPARRWSECGPISSCTSTSESKTLALPDGIPHALISPHLHIGCTHRHFAEDDAVIRFLRLNGLYP